MKKTLFGCILASLCLAAATTQAITINLGTGELKDQNGVILANGVKLKLIASTQNSTFGNLTSSNLASATSFTEEADDIILAEYNLDDTTFQAGSHIQAIVFNNAANGGPTDLTAGDPLLFVWYADPVGVSGPGVGVNFGTFRTDATVDGSDTGWVVPAGNGDTVTLNFYTVNAGGTQLESAGNASQITATPPAALIAVCQNVTVTNTPGLCTATVTGAQVDGGSTTAVGQTITSRSLFPAGPYADGDMVTLTVIDSLSRTDSCGLATITVIDGQAPTFSLPAANVTVTTATSTDTDAVVNFTISATDNCGSATVTNDLPSGSTFGLGSTTVTSYAFDPAGNVTSRTFNVIVNQAAEGLGAISTAVNALTDPKMTAGRKSALNGALSRAQARFDAYNLDTTKMGKLKSACAQLKSFIIRVTIYKRLGIINATDADALLASANAAKLANGCP